MFKSYSKVSDSDFFQDANFKITPTQTKLKLTNNIHKSGRLDEITSDATFIIYIHFLFVLSSSFHRRLHYPAMRSALPILIRSDLEVYLCYVNQICKNLTF